VRQAVVIDKDKIEATPFKIGDRPQQRLPRSHLVILQRQSGRLPPGRRGKADEIEGRTLLGGDRRHPQVCLDADLALVG
jgi:hypothetical protein